MSKKMIVSTILALSVLAGVSGPVAAHSTGVVINQHHNVLSIGNVRVQMPQVMSQLRVNLPASRMVAPTIVVPAYPANRANTASVTIVDIAPEQETCASPFAYYLPYEMDQGRHHDCSEVESQRGLFADLPLFGAIMERTGIAGMFSMLGLTR